MATMYFFVKADTYGSQQVPAAEVGALVEEEPPVVRQLVCWPDDLEDPVQAGHAVVGGVFAHPGDQQHPAAVGVLDAQAPYFAAEDVDAQS